MSVFFENLGKGLYTATGYAGLINYYVKNSHSPAIWKTVMGLAASHTAMAAPMQACLLSRAVSDFMMACYCACLYNIRTSSSGTCALRTRTSTRIRASSATARSLIASQDGTKTT